MDNIQEQKCKMSKEMLLQFIKNHREQDYDKFVRIISSREKLQNDEQISYEVDNDRYTLCIHQEKKDIFLQRIGNVMICKK